MICARQTKVHKLVIRHNYWGGRVRGWAMSRRAMERHHLTTSDRSKPQNYVLFLFIHFLSHSPSSFLHYISLSCNSLPLSTEWLNLSFTCATTLLVLHMFHLYYCHSCFSPFSTFLFCSSFILIKDEIIWSSSWPPCLRYPTMTFTCNS